MSASPRLSEGQFTLLTLLLVQAACGVATMAVLWIGLAVVMQWMIALFVLAGAAILLGLCSRFSPRLAVNAAVFGLMGLMLLPLVPCWLVRSRDEARSNQYQMALRSQGEYHLAAQFYRPAPLYFGEFVSERCPEPVPRQIDLANKFEFPSREELDMLAELSADFSSLSID